MDTIVEATKAGTVTAWTLEMLKAWEFQVGKSGNFTDWLVFQCLASRQGPIYNCVADSPD